MVILFCFCSCGPEKPTDVVANKYYSEYLKIYSEYGQIPLDSTENSIKSFLLNFPNDAKAWNFYGTISLRKGNVKKAKDAFAKSLFYDSKFANSFSQLGYLCLLESELDSAKYYLEKAIYLGDSSNSNFLNLAFLCNDNDDTLCASLNADKLYYQKDSISNIELASLVIIYSKGFHRQEVSDLIQLLKHRKFKRMDELNSVLSGKMRRDSFLIKNIYEN
jgi:tetratricopeptide (TPR) repeat protein